jgi:glucose-6-phosphate 1-dehydrogenase
MFGTGVQGLAKAGCDHDARVVVEKPFGRDLASAQALNRTLHEVFQESAAFRIDPWSQRPARSPTLPEDRVLTAVQKLALARY